MKATRRPKENRALAPKELDKGIGGERLKYAILVTLLEADVTLQFY